MGGESRMNLNYVKREREREREMGGRHIYIGVIERRVMRPLKCSASGLLDQIGVRFERISVSA